MTNHPQQQRSMKKLLFKILRYSGLPFLFREMIQQRKVTILLFHDINKETAVQTFSYLARKYNVIALADFIRACKDKRHKLPKKALIITFDDGHKRNFELLPVVQKLNIPVTIFLCSGIINTNRHFWFTHKHPHFSSDDLKRVSNLKKLDILARTGFSVTKTYDEPQALTKAQIKEMSHVVDFQAHTMFHPCLPMCHDDEAAEEIFQSKQVLEADFGLNINAFAYPNGDYSDRDIRLLQEAGYECAITVDYGFNTTQTDLFRLKRLSVNDADNLDELIVKASGVWGWFKTRNGRKQDHGWMQALTQTTQIIEDQFKIN